MRPMHRLAFITAGCLLATTEGYAANAGFQNLFFAACASPTGALASRCAETPSGQGNLSGDSESSLNPSQKLSQTQTVTSVAQARSKEARERSERFRDDQPAPASEGAKVGLGPFSLLLNIHGSWYERDDTYAVNGMRGFDGDSRALEIGFDYRASDRYLVGAILGAERFAYDFTSETPGVNFVPSASGGDVDYDNTYLLLFGNWLIGSGGFVELSAAYEKGDGTYSRNAVFQESTRTRPQTNSRAAGDTDGTTTWISANAGFDVSRDALSFGPYVGLTWTNAEIDGYAEQDLSGSGLAMRYADAESDSLLGHLGVRMSRAWSTGGGVVVPQLRIEYQHEFNDDPAEATATFVLDSAKNQYQFSYGGADRSFYNAGLSVATIRPNGWSFFADVSLLLGNATVDRTRASVGLRKEF